MNSYSYTNNAGGALTAPVQERSRLSLTRMLDATERLLSHKDFTDISIAEIADEAGVSVGNFYNRFPSKDALLDVLHDRYERERVDFLRKSFATAAANGGGLEVRVAAAINAIVALFRARRGVLRSLILRHWRDPANVSARTRRRVDVVFAEAHALLLGARDEIRHASPPFAVRLGFQTVLAAAREAIVLRPANLPGTATLSDKALASELTRLLIAYLTAGPDNRP